MLYAGALLSHETAVLFWIGDCGVPVSDRRASASANRFGSPAPFIVLAVLYLGARLDALGIAHFAGRPDFVRPASRLDGRNRFRRARLLDIIMTMPVALLTYLEVLADPRNGRSDP